MKKNIIKIAILLFTVTNIYAYIEGVKGYVRSSAIVWRNGTAMAKTNCVIPVCDMDGDGFDVPGTNSTEKYIVDGDSYAGTTGIDIAPALGYMKTSYNASLMESGRVISQFSAGDIGFTDAKDACIRIYSDYSVVNAAYYVHGSSMLITSPAASQDNDKGNEFFCDEVNPAYRIPNFSITTPELDDNLILSGIVLSQADSTSNINTLDDSIIRICWRNLSSESLWQTDNPACVDGMWTFSIAEGDFNSEVSNQFEAYAYAVSDRNLLPMSDLGNTIWLQKPAAVQGPYIAVTAPANFPIYDSPRNITITGVSTDNVSVASVKMGSVDVDNFSGPGNNCAWEQEVSLVEGTNSFTFTATDDEELTDSVTVRYIVKSSDTIFNPPYIKVTSPVNFSIYPTPTNIFVSGISTDNFSVVTITRNGTDLSVVPGNNLSWTNNIPETLLPKGTNSFVYIATDNEGNTATDTVSYIILSDGNVDTNPCERVLCTWPRYIGGSQIGSVEFLSKYACNYYIDAEVSNGVSKVVASGVCTSGWNLVPFAGAMLPYQIASGSSNVLSLRLDYITKVVTNEAGVVTVVEDLKFDSANSKLYAEDVDGDLIFIKYKSKTGGKLNIKGRTLFIEGGASKDKLMIKVKSSKAKTGDGTARICGVISSSGLKMIKSFASIDMIQADETVEKIIIKGSLGFPSDTWRYHVRFPAPLLKAKTKITTKRVKNSLTKQLMPETGNIYASILAGKLKNEVKAGELETDPFTLSDTEALGGIVMILANGGNIGVDKDTAEKYNIIHPNRRLTAGYVKKVMAKPDDIAGGKIVDYSFYLDNEYQTGNHISCAKIVASDFVDNSGANSNMLFVMGFNSTIIKSPSTITSWIGQDVKYNFKKIIVKSGQLEGSIVTKNSVDKAKQIKGIDVTNWIIDGKLE